MMKLRVLALLLSLFGTQNSEAFSSPSHVVVRQGTTHLLGVSKEKSNDVIRQDIEAMREEAMERLRLLNEQMDQMMKDQEELKAINKAAAQEEEMLTTTTGIQSPSSSGGVEESLIDVMDLPTKKIPTTSNKKIPPQPPTTTKQVVKEEEKNPSLELSNLNSIKLLEGTRWKIVLKIRSSPKRSLSTKRMMEHDPKPLLIHLVVDFGPEQLKENDSLLHGVKDAGVLHIKESWIAAGSTTEGRQQNVNIRPEGGWKILRGQGPKGIDVLRFFFDVREEICHQEGGALFCPAERIYATCGYFCMGQHVEAEKHKDELRNRIDRLVEEHDNLALKDRLDEKLFSWTKLKRGKKLLDLNLEIKHAHEELQTARARDPEKSLLRLSRKRDAGVTKEGQICHKIGHGLSVEYHVLGKMEMASVVIRDEMEGYHP